MNRVPGLIALLALAILAIVVVIGVTQPIRVEPSSATPATITASQSADAGSLDSILDAIHVEHAVKHGR